MSAALENPPKEGLAAWRKARRDAKRGLIMGLDAKTLGTGVQHRRRGIAVAKFAALVLFAYFVGSQIYEPNPRVVKFAVACLLFWMTVKSRLHKVIAVLAFIIPFSAGTSVGTTSSLAIIMVFLIWMARVATGGSKPTWKSPASISILVFIMIHILSFYNTPAGYQMDFGLKTLGLVLSSVLLFYLILNFVNDERGLRRLIWASMLSCMAVIILSQIELYAPGLRLIPWFTVPKVKMPGQFATIWVGGPFRDGELLGEYMAVSIPLQAFMLTQSRTMYGKAFWAIMVLGSVATGLATMHRGPLISMSIGLVYLLMLFRKRMKLHTLLGAVLVGLAFLLTMEFIMATYTPTGSVIQRLERTKFYGVVPDSRRGPWTQAWERSLEHPWIGHGPYYDIGYPVATYYAAHSTYLHYFYTIGAIGVVIFGWFLVNLIRMTVRYMSVRTGIVSFSTDLLVALHVQIVVFIIDAIKINYQRNTMYYMLVWLVFGMCGACYRVAERRTAEVRELERAQTATMGEGRVGARGANHLGASVEGMGIGRGGSSG
jgi:hypothetical protein